jgi:hypothetical protein
LNHAVVDREGFCAEPALGDDTGGVQAQDLIKMPVEEGNAEGCTILNAPLFQFVRKVEY